MGASGGLLIAWNDNIFSGQLHHINDFSLTIQFSSKLDGDSWFLTNVYGPCQPNERADFINWFQNFSMADEARWIIWEILTIPDTPSIEVEKRGA